MSRIEHNPFAGYLVLGLITAAAGVAVGTLGVTGLQVAVTLLVLVAIYRGAQHLIQLKSHESESRSSNAREASVPTEADTPSVDESDLEFSGDEHIAITEVDPDHFLVRVDKSFSGGEVIFTNTEGQIVDRRTYGPTNTRSKQRSVAKTVRRQHKKRRLP